ncbi:MAG: MBL fold metallo-hydrolase [Gemmatimonadaceae bacterium]|nr:MBL fold metallo-hydrolase [Gemmatimonadaceae bacterium]
MTPERPLRDPRSGRFRNALPVRQPNPFAVLRALFTERFVTAPEQPVPIERRARADFAVAPAHGVRVTWLGHATLLIEVEGVRVLTDPVWAERASISQAFGPRRFFPPPLALDALPALDAVLLTHDHYDHLDKATIRTLASRGLPFIAPTGMTALLAGWGVPEAQVTERSWWEQVQLQHVTVTLTPARHFSGRSALFTDRDRRLWCGYALTGRERRVYYAGDSSLAPEFAVVGERLGPFDISMFEIGAYSHLWRDVHMGPEQAVRAHRMSRGGLMLPIHWGTFDLALHGWTEPAERVMAAAEREGVSLAMPRPGAMVDPLLPPPLERWWPTLPWRSAEEYPVVSSGVEGLFP